jgi:putative DNA primase/helicase
MGWALEILGSARCREIAESFLRVEKVYGTKLHGFCPVHGDQKSASAFYNFETDSGSCTSCGEKWDLVRLWCLAHGHDGQDLKAFREEFDGDYTGGAKHLRPAKPKIKREPPPAPPEVFVDPADLAELPPLPSEIIDELKLKRGWNPAVIAALDLREYTDAKKKKRIAIPVITDNGQIGNIRLYMPGAEQYKMISWFDHKCKACGGAWKITKGQPKVCKDCGASPNDYGRSRLFPPPSEWKSGTIWLCEGESDMICARSQGLNAVTQTAGCGTWTEEFTLLFEGRDVVIVYDCDHAGHRGAMKAAESIAQVAKSVRVMVWPELMGQEDEKE